MEAKEAISALADALAEVVEHIPGRLLVIDAETGIILTLRAVKPADRARKIRKTLPALFAQARRAKDGAAVRFQRGAKKRA